MNEFEKGEMKEAFVILIVNEWDRIRNSGVLRVENEWEMFKSTARVCGYKSKGRKKRGSAWWDEEIREMVREKRKLSEINI